MRCFQREKNEKKTHTHKWFSYIWDEKLEKILEAFLRVSDGQERHRGFQVAFKRIHGYFRGFQVVPRTFQGVSGSLAVAFRDYQGDSVGSQRVSWCFQGRNSTRFPKYLRLLETSLKTLWELKCCSNSLKIL